MAGEAGSAGFEAKRDRFGAAGLELVALTSLTARLESAAHSTLSTMSAPWFFSATILAGTAVYKCPHSVAAAPTRARRRFRCILLPSIRRPFGCGVLRFVPIFDLRPQ
jgi:hypothetical protein